MNIVRITELQDHLLGGALDIYQRSFPLNEQVPLSTWINFIRQLVSGGADSRFLLVLEIEGKAAAMAYFEIEPAIGELGPTAFLWYIATSPELRGGGVGATIYHEVARLATENGCQALVFEVESPAVAAQESDEVANIAKRRIAWYRRNGAFLVSGVHYIQDVGWQEPVEMNLMVHPIGPLKQSQLLPLLKAIFADRVNEVGDVFLESYGQ